MKADDVFVRKMFKIVDKDRDGRISFQEFLDTVVLFSTQGRTDDKLRIIFAMCDSNENGLIDKTELQEMLTSLVEMAKTEKVLPQDVEKLIDSMFQAAGFEDKDVLTYNDFKAMMKEFNGDFLTVGLDCKGAKHNFLDTTTNIARMENIFTLDEPRTAAAAAAEEGAEGADLVRGAGWWKSRWNRLTTFLEENRQNIFYLLVFFAVNVWLFVERFVRKYLSILCTRNKRKKSYLVSF